jgi:LPS O-antigen subunit length determinant protein (WzzB/FepE family)
MAADKANAEFIRDLVGDASLRMRDVLDSLRRAQERATQDYEHNGDRITDSVGLANTLVTLLIQEHSTWSGYADNRAE